MKQNRSIGEIFSEYEECLAARNRATGAVGEGADILKERYRTLQGEIKAFCSSEGFLSIMQVLCRINAGKLRFAPAEGKMEFLGKVPAPLAFDAETCFAVKDEAKRMMLAVRAGSPRDEAAIMALCVGYVTLMAIAGSARALFDCTMAKNNAAKTDEIARLDARLKELEKALRVRFAESGSAKNTDVLIGTRTPAANGEAAERLQRVLGIDTTLPDEQIALSTRDGAAALFVKVADAQKNTALFHNFVNGIFYRNLHRFGVGELALALIEDNRLSSLPLSQMHTRLLTHDKTEANLYAYSFGNMAQDEEGAERLLQAIVNEMNSRKPLLGVASGYTDIGEYNEKNPYNKKPIILLLINGDSGVLVEDKTYRNLLAILKDGGRYGVYTVLFGRENTAFDTETNQISKKFGAYGVRSVALDDPLLQLVSADSGAVDNIRREAKTTLKQSEILYLDDLLATKPAVSHFSKEITIPVGLAGGKLYYFATSVDATKGEYHASPFTLIIGSTGMGKSAFLHTLILGGASCYSPEELQFYIVDFKSKVDSAEFSSYLYKEGEENLYIPHVRYLSMKSTAENAYDVLDMINTLADERAALFATVGTKDFIAYNSEPRIRARVESGELPHVPQIYFLIDEYITMLGGGVGGDQEASMEIESRFADVLQRVRTSGVGLIFSGQRAAFKSSTMGLIGNRIAFDPGNESLLDAMFSFDYAAGEDNSALYRSISGKIGTAASTRSAGAGLKEVVRTAFAGKHMGERQLALAKAIREKYKNSPYYAKQIVPGEDVMELGDSFLSEYCSEPVSPEEMKRQAMEKELRVPLYLGISAMTSKPIPLSFYLQKLQGSVVLARPVKQERIERNIAVSLLHYMAVNGNAPQKPVIVLNDLMAAEQLTDVFGNVIEGGNARHALLEALDEQGLSHLCIMNRRATDIARSVMQAEALWNERLAQGGDRTPLLLIFHDAGTLCSLQRYLDLESKATAAPAPKAPVTPEVSGPQMEQTELVGLMGEDAQGDEAMAAIANLFDVNVSVDDVDVDALSADEEYYSAAEVKSALCHLMREGNQQNIFVVFACSDADAAENLLGIRLSQADACKELCGVVFGSDGVRKSGDAFHDENPDCCFVLPQKLKARLYDFSARATGFWENLKKYY